MPTVTARPVRATRVAWVLAVLLVAVFSAVATTLRGPTDTAFISDGAGWDRGKMLRPQIMGPPACWLISDEAADYTGNRIIAANWDAKLSGREAAQKAGRAIGWPELGADAVWLRG